MAAASIMHEGVMGTTEGEQWRTSRQPRWKADLRIACMRNAAYSVEVGNFQSMSRTVPTDPFETAVNVREPFYKKCPACLFEP
jgi:hypothetical protein